MASKVAKYKVWIHIEGVDRNGDCVEGDEFHEPHSAGEYTTRFMAEKLRNRLIDIAAIINDE